MVLSSTVAATAVGSGTLKKVKTESMVASTSTSPPGRKGTRPAMVGRVVARRSMGREGWCARERKIR